MKNLYEGIAAGLMLGDCTIQQFEALSSLGCEVDFFGSVDISPFRCLLNAGVHCTGFVRFPGSSFRQDLNSGCKSTRLVNRNVVFVQEPNDLRYRKYGFPYSVHLGSFE